MTELARKIRESREAKGVSIEELAEKTKISHRFLRALEADRQNQMPDRVVAKGFVKRLARYLNASEADFSRLFDEAYPESTPQEVAAAPAKKEFAFKREQLYLLVSGIILILAVALVMNAYFSNPSRQETPAPAVPESPPVVVPPASVAAQPAPPSQGLQITLTANEDTWVQVMADGNTVYEEVIPARSSKAFEAKERVRIFAGNSQNLLVKINGKDYGPLDPGRTVSRILFTLGDEKPTILSPPAKTEASPGAKL